MGGLLFRGAVGHDCACDRLQACVIGVHNITLLVQPRVRVWEQGDIALGSASFRGYI